MRPVSCGTPVWLRIVVGNIINRQTIPGTPAVLRIAAR